MGDLRGKMAIERGITIDELNAIGMNDPSTDRAVDELQKRLGETEDNFIIDGWLSWFFIPRSFKVWLTVDPIIGAERIFHARHAETAREDEPLFRSSEETQNILAERTANNEARYQKWYGISLKNDGKYDLIIDTTHRTPQEVAALIIAALPKDLDPQA